jgi:hypothetical protein
MSHILNPDQLKQQPTPAAELPKPDYQEQLKQDFYLIIDSLESINAIQKEYMKRRWLDQVLWMETRSGKMRNWHRRLRVAMIVASSLVPLVTIIDTNCNSTAQQIIKLVTVGLSVIVTVGATLDEFFSFGDRWYSYRKAVELLKSHGWQFLELTGLYREYDDHAEAFPVFSEQIESIIQRDVELYVTEGMRQKEQQPKPSPAQTSNKVQASNRLSAPTMPNPQTNATSHE